MRSLTSIAITILLCMGYFYLGKAYSDNPNQPVIQKKFDKLPDPVKQAIMETAVKIHGKYEEIKK